MVFRMAENATRPVPDLTDMPSALPDGSAEGVESHTTRHFPSNTIGSVSFWHLTSEGPQWARRSSPTKKAKQGVRCGEEGRDGQGIAPNEDELWLLLGFAGVFTPKTVTEWPPKRPQRFSEYVSYWSAPHFSNTVIISPGKKTLQPRESHVSWDIK